MWSKLSELVFSVQKLRKQSNFLLPVYEVSVRWTRAVEKGAVEFVEVVSSTGLIARESKI